MVILILLLVSSFIARRKVPYIMENWAEMSRILIFWRFGSLRASIWIYIKGIFDCSEYASVLDKFYQAYTALNRMSKQFIWLNQSGMILGRLGSIQTSFWRYNESIFAHPKPPSASDRHSNAYGFINDKTDQNWGEINRFLLFGRLGSRLLSFWWYNKAIFGCPEHASVLDRFF